MKHFLEAVAGAALLACTSVQSTTVSSSDIATMEGEAVALIQAHSVGWTFFWHSLTVVNSDLEQVVNKLLMEKAKSMGANKVELKGAYTSPRGGLYGLPALVMGFPGSFAVGVAVK